MLGIYARTSNTNKDRFSIESQITSGIKSANQLGLSYKTYIDDGISGTTDDTVRDGLSELFDDIKSRKISHVYVYDQSRIERNGDVWRVFVTLCLANNVKYYPSGTKLDLDNDENRMFASMMSLFNSYYAAITSKKVRLANARKAANGKTHGLKPYGYKKGKDNTYEVDEEEAIIVRRIYKMSLNGMGTYTIANTLNDEKIKTKFSKNFKGIIHRKDIYTGLESEFDKSKIKWTGNTIYGILRNKIYKGILEWNRYKDIKSVDDEGKTIIKKVIEETIIYDRIPIIVNTKLWDATGENLSLNKKNVGKKAKYKYLLNGIIKCGHCGNDFVGKRRKTRDSAYKCKSKFSSYKSCEYSRGISIDKIEAFIIRKLCISTELLQNLKDSPVSDSELVKLKTTKTKFENQIKKVTSQKKRLLNLLIDLDTDEHQIKQLKDKLSVSNKDSLELKNNLKNINEKIASFNVDSSQVSVRNIIRAYSEQVGFTTLRINVENIIEKIVMRHFKEVGKASEHIIMIKYQNSSLIQVFVTNRMAFRYRELFNIQMSEEIITNNSLTNEEVTHYSGKYRASLFHAFNEVIGDNESSANLGKINPFSDNYNGQYNITLGSRMLIVDEDDYIKYN